MDRRNSTSHLSDAVAVSRFPPAAEAMQRVLPALRRMAVAGTCVFGVVGGAIAKSGCSDVYLPVSMVAGGPKTELLYGQLCHPSRGPSRTVQILLHGYTYNHDYWSAPVGALYDYVAVATSAGYSTFAVDRLGSIGRSSRPLSATVTLFSNAVNLHDVVQAARSVTLPGGPYEKVVTVGHSLGSMTAWTEAHLFNDVDGIIATGAAHPLGNAQGMLTNTVPALTDARLAPYVGLDAGYTTTAPGSRGPLFYRLENADPAVIAYDEATKGVGTATELSTLAGYESATLTLTAPVLQVIGQYDALFCAQAGKGAVTDCSTDQSFAATERLFFPLVQDYESFVQVGSGHDNNLHLSAMTWYQRAVVWAKQRFPTK